VLGLVTEQHDPNSAKGRLDVGEPGPVATEGAVAANGTLSMRLTVA